MARVPLPDVLEHFSIIPDPRVQGRCLHAIEDIFFVAICGSLAGCDSPDEMALFAELHQEWFKEQNTLKNGVPSHDTISRVFNLVKPEAFSRALSEWIMTFLPGTAAERAAKEHLISIDGKTVRGSARPTRGVAPLHLLNAWSVTYRACLGVQPVGDKSNEIPELPSILRTLELKGAIVTIDAMGTQKEVAATIKEGGGDYVLALKNNHPKLAQAVTEVFEEINSHDPDPNDPNIYETSESGHGRHEKRVYSQIPLPPELQEYAEQWPGLKSIGYCSSLVQRGERESLQLRFYISSLEVDVERFARCVRGHWRIENTLHWTLDMTLSEDMSTTYLRHATANLASLRRLTVSILKQKTSKESMKRMRKRASWDLNFLKDLLC